MEKKYIIGGLAVVGVIALIAYLNKPKRNSEGFFGADGKISSRKGNCMICRSSPTSLAGYWARDGYCAKGDYCSQKITESIQK